MRRSKADVDRYVSSVQSASPSLKEKPVKGFLFAKLYFEAKEYELAKRYVSSYLAVQERDPKAHKFLGQLYEREGSIDKAVGCYKRSVDLNPAQKDLVLKVAELLCSKPERDSRAEFWLEKAAKLLPGSPAVYNLKEKLLSSQGQQGWNQLFDLLQSELQLRPENPHINIRLVCLYCSDGRLEEAVNHCLAVEKKGTLRCSLDWYSTVVRTLQDFLTLPSVLSNEKVRRKLQKELLLAQCSLLRLSLAERTVSQCVEALHSFDNTMQETTKLVGGAADELSEAFTEMRGHLYLHAGTLLLKKAHVKEQQWRAVTDLAALCYLLAYRVPKPKGRPSKGERGAPAAMESLACDRLSQSGHMLLNLSQENDYFVKEVVEAFGNRSGQGSLFEMLFGTEAPAGPSFIGNDDIRSIGAEAPDVADLAKSDAGAIPQHSGDLQQLVWLGLQWALMGQRAALRDWLMKLFPRLTLETSKLDTNTPESICLLDLEVFLCGVVFCSQTQLQETRKISASSQLHEVRCLPLQLIKLLSNERQRDWWNAVYSLLHNRALPGTSAKLRMTVQHGLSTLRAGEKHGLQPALVIQWARHLRETGSGFDSYYDQKEYIGRSVHYWKVVLPLLEKIKKRRSIPEPLDPLFMHFASKDLQISEVKGLEEEVRIALAILLDIEGKTEEAIATLENINSISASWHLAQIFQRLSEQAGNGVEENQDRCITFLKRFQKQLSIIYTANADETDKLPIAMEEVMDLLNDVNQQLGESGRDINEEEEGQSAHSSPNQLAEPGAPASRIKFSTPSPTKNALSPSKRHIFSPPHWAEDQKSILQMLCQQVEALTNEVHDLRHNSTGATASPHHRMYDQGYGAEGLQEPFPAAQSFHGAPLTVATTGPSGPVYYNPSPAYNSQYLLRTTANVTPTKAPVYGMNRLPPQQHMYAYQQPTHTPPLQTNPGCMYPQDQVYGAPLRFESPATMLSPYSEEYYNHGVPQPSTNPPLPEPGYFTKPVAVPVQPPKGNEVKPMEFGKIGFGQQIPVEPPKVPTFGAGVVAQSTPAAASFKFNSNFKSNDGDFTFPSMQIKNSESLLGLLTSDLPPRNEQPIGQKAATQDQSPVSQTGVFNFGVEKAAGFSFADAAQSQSKAGLFGNTDQSFSFTDMTKPVFGTPSAEEHEKPESDGEGARVDEDEDGPHFEPIVPLPDKVDVKTGEEEEEEMFCNRAKLFRFDSETKEWKERGIGSIKILRHRMSGKVRLLMRREQVLKICANHYITADMVLKPNAGSDKSWVWYAIDYADEMPKPEQLAIRFKTTEEAALFKTKFEEAQKVVPKSPQKQEQPVEKEHPPKVSSPQTAGKDLDFGALFAKKEGEWDCSVCCIRNSPADVKCVACQNPNPNAKSEAEGKAGEEVKGFAATIPSAGTFTFGFGKNASKDSSSASTTQPFGSFSQLPTTIKFGTSDSASKPMGFGAQFEKKPGQWDCSTCSVRNEASANQCAACQSPNPSCKSVFDSGAVSNSSTASFEAGFGSQFLKKEGEWDCSVCSVRNGPTVVKCVACQNPNPTAESEAEGKSGKEFKGFAATVPSAGNFTFGFGKDVPKDSSSSASTQPFGSFSQFPTTIKFGTSDSASKPIGFGAQFEKKPGQWDCRTCSVRNEASANQCAACQSPNPSCKSVFDSGAVSNSSTASFEAVFGSQFLKKEGEWDCSVCSVRNGPTAVKCVACQNPNPTAESEAEGKSGKEFKGFAATVPSAGNFTFGFGKDLPKDSSSSASTQPFDSFSQFPTTIKFGTSDSASKPIGFGAQFEKKPGQWDCNTCSVRNEASANQCISCQAPNPSSKSVLASPAVSKSSTASFEAGFGSQFLKKEGEWDCSVCSVRNGPTAVKCVACQNPNPTAESEAEGKSGKEFKGFAAMVPSAGTFVSGFGKDVSKDSSATASTQPFDSFSQFPTTIKFGTSDSASKPIGFGAQFEKKPGQWDCNTCSVRNEASANQCISCQAPNPSSKSVLDSPAASKPSTAPFGAGFCSQFTKKEGQWDCDTCLVRNEASATKCASCMTPRKISPNEGLAAMFGKKGGQWDCGTCLVRNDASASACVSCQTPNPNANVASTTPANVPAPQSSAFAFSIGSQKASDAPATTGVKASFNIGTAFKFGQGEEKGSAASFKFELPHAQAESKPSSSKGFSFSMPIPAGPFKFGTKEPVTLAAPAEVSSDAGPASICLKNMAEQHRDREEKEVVNAGPSQEGTEQEENPLFSGKQNTFTFADLAKSSQGNFQFGQKDPSFSGFSRAGEQLFTSLKSSEKPDSAQDQDEEDMYKTEEHDDIQFDPVVQMPERVDLVTGEEDEEVLYSHRVKLFRFDADTSQWKERGVGNLKILKNSKNGKLRVVMRREQVFKVCANHLITTTMNLKPLSGSDRAWMWLANDFSEGDAKLEQLAAKFKTPEMAEEFKQKFEECQRLLLDIPLQTPHKLVDTGRTAHLIQKAEEMKTGLKDLKSFLTDDKAKIKEQGSQVDDTAPNRTSASINKPHSEACMSLEWDNYDLQEDALDKTAETSVCTSPLATSLEVRKNLFRFGESTAGFSFSFQPISPSKSPAKLDQSRASVGTDDESETQEEERDGQYFEPVVSLPDLVEISTGEENELVVFCHRAKLYRYDKELSQWKERGIGDIKILQNKDTKRVRLVMRRDQVLKLCANHWITSTIKLEPMKGAEKAWIWSALDFSEDEGKVEQLAVRFKLLEVANAFKDVFEAAKNAEEGNTVLTPVSTKECTPRKTTCGLAAIAALEETTRERTELPQSSHDKDSSNSPAADHGQQTPSKTIVSPPKFVFGSDSVQKIFGSPPSSTELMPSIKTSSKDKEASAASPSFKVPESASAVHPSSATSTPSMPTFKVPTRAASGAVQERAGVGAKTDGSVEQGDSKDLQIVFVREPTAEQEAFARSLLLPRTFFCYQNEPGYVSDDSTDDEDYETAVRKLNGKLYPDPPEAVTLETGTPETVTRETVVHAEAPVDPPAGERDAECVIVWEKKPTPEEQERAARLQLPPTFFCGVGSDEGEKDKPDDFETELRKAQEDLKRTEGSEVADPVVSSSSDAPAAEEQASPQPDSSSEATPAPSCPTQDSAPIDLSTKKGPETEPDSTSQEPTTAFAGFGGFGSLGSLGEFSFADLAKNTSDFAFGKQDVNFSWANAGATVFGAAPATQTEADQPGSDEEATSSADIHFDPIVSLPEVETKSGEEDEEILFKERAKLFRWDCKLNQWKERGVGDIKILYHPQKRCYRVLMRRDQVLKVCANHTITQGMKLMPMNTSNNALVWNATDYAEGSAQIEQLAAKFKTAELADSFRKKFEECLSRLSQADCGQMSRALEHSREGNPTVFFCVSADQEPLGKITMELFSHIVPKTAENFRVLSTGERGFGFRNSVFHRIIPDFMCQGGDITNQDGTGGKSIYGEKFEDENFDVRHTGPGLLSMANRGRDTNNSQFFITLKKAEHLDFKHVAFGFVKDGMDVVKRMGELGAKSGKPSKKIVITDSGQLQ